MPFPGANINTWKKDIKCMCCGKTFYATVLNFEVEEGVCGPCDRDRAYDRLPPEKKDLYRRIGRLSIPARREDGGTLGQP